MHAKKLARVLGVTLLLTLAACGGSTTDPGDGGNDNGGSHFTAKIDGAAWSSAPLAQIAVRTTLPGLYSLTGSEVGGGYVITLSLYDIGATGTYPIGVGPTVAGASAVVANAAGGWSTPLSGAAGSITITTLTETRITGRFNFTAEPQSGSASGTKTVTDGDFDLIVTPQGPLLPVPDNAASKVSATIGGEAWNAATVGAAVSNIGQPIFSIAASNDARAVTISLTGAAGPGTYSFSAASPTGTIGVTNTEAPLSHIWTTSGAGGSGTVVITSYTSTRIQGTFNATMGPGPGSQTTGSLTIASGSFDVGLPQAQQ